MTEISSNSVEGLRGFVGQVTKLSGEELEDYKRTMEQMERMRAGPSEQELAAARARQNAVQAHTVFRAGDKIVAVYYRDGTTTYPQGGDVGGSVAAQKEAEAKGLSGAEARDYIANAITARLKQLYGSGLSVESYASGNAPTRGELNTEMFGAMQSRTSSSYVNFDVKTWEKMQEA